MSPASNAEFHLLYWPGLPGRGEFIRLALEEAGVKYRDSALEKGGVELMQAQMAGDDKNPPFLAPPALRHGDVLMSQTPNILQYLSEVLPEKLAPHQGDVAARHHIHQLALTALDGFSNEAHETHHPIAVRLTYEEQKPEALRRAEDYVKYRLPKYLEYFERVLSAPSSGAGPWLYGGQLSYADLVLFQCVDGVKYAFPKAMAKAEASGKYAKVFALYEAVKERPNIKTYLAGERRQKYGLGIWRHYPEMDFA